MSANPSPAPEVDQWRARAEELRPIAKPFIGGEYVDPEEAARFESINPASGLPVCEVPKGSAADVDRAVAAARGAFARGDWSKASPIQRKIALLRLADLIEQNGDELALLDTLEIGKPIMNARAEIAMTSGYFRFCAEALDKLYGHVAASPHHILSLSRLEPRGVVGAIVPWNFPLANAGIKAAPALAVGNSVVLKPSEIASLSALRLAELAVEAGVPSGVFNVVPGLGSTVGDAIARHADLDFLSFTGSTATGRRLMCSAGESNGKPLMLELGGKSAQIVSCDMVDDLEPLASQIIHDAFWNQGQWCAARSRLLIDDRIYDRLVEAIVVEAKRLEPGDPLEPSTRFGTIASQAQFDRIQYYIAQGYAAGATAILTGSHGSPCQLSMGPTIFGDVTPGMTIASEEIFGPVLCVMRFGSFDEAVQIANSTTYGLGASVWTRDATEIAAAIDGLQAGRVIIRSRASASAGTGFSLGAEPWRASGFGVERGLDGLRSYCRPKAVEWLA